MRSRITLLAVLGAGTVLLICALLFMRPEMPAWQAGTLLERPRPIGDFRLVDQANRPFTRERLKHRWHLLFLGFTHCPDVCPTTLSLLSTLDKRLLASGTELQTVLLSADPQRDTPEALARYLAHFNPRFVGATGPAAELSNLCRSLGLGYVHNPGPAGDYTVDHSAALVLIDPRARVAGYFQPPHDVDLLAADLIATIGSKR